MIKLIEDIPLDFTIAIPTYNGADRLPKVLDRLLHQKDIEKYTWEIIVVDNNSSDSTFELIQHYQKDWHQTFNLRYLLETRQGSAFARLRAVQESISHLIGFLDDDVLPDPDWIAQAIAFAKDYPQAGAYGGQIHGQYEITPPTNFERIQVFFAIREQGANPHLFDPNNLRLPPGAAIVVRKQAWSESVPSVLAFKGRLGKSMVGGEDLEPLLYLHKGGWQIWYNPAMHAYHQIPCWRLERDYLLKLADGCGLSIFQLRSINAKSWQKPIIFFRVFLSNLRRVLEHLLKYKYQLKNDIIALFEIRFYLSSMISPFYFLKCYLKKQ